jgi:hypothetical protein
LVRIKDWMPEIENEIYLVQAFFILLATVLITRLRSHFSENFILAMLSFLSWMKITDWNLFAISSISHTTESTTHKHPIKLLKIL